MTVADLITELLQYTAETEVFTEDQQIWDGESLVDISEVILTKEGVVIVPRY